METVYLVTLSLALLSPTVAGLETLTEQQLSSVTGEGIGAVVEDLSLFTNMPGRTESGELTLVIDEDHSLVVSDIRLHRADFEYNSDPATFIDAGGNFGTEQSPFKLGDLVQVNSILDSGGAPNFTYTALRTQFPGAEIGPEEVTDELLDQYSDKFDLSLRIDSVITDGTRPLGSERRFDFSMALEGFRFYGFQTDLWAIPYYGLALSSTVGLRADAIIFGGDENNMLSGDLALNNVDIYLPAGSPDQPLVMSTVDVDGKEQLQFEILPLSKELAAKQQGNIPKGHVYVESIYFGDPRDPALRTALKPGGDPLDPEAYYYAFQPENGTNVLSVEGISIQHLKITTLDI